MGVGHTSYIRPMVARTGSGQPARERWPVRAYGLGEEPGDDPSATAGERLACVEHIEQDVREVRVLFLGRAMLVANKRSTGRRKDLETLGEVPPGT